MDLEDSFTRKLMERTLARREQIDKKLGLTSGTMATTAPSTKRRRTPLADENASFEDSFEELEELDERDSESPKRPCYESSLSSSTCDTPLETPAQTPEQSPLRDNKENSPAAMPALGLRGLAAIKRKKSAVPSPKATISDSPNHLEHEESQGFTKSPSAARLTYNYPERDQEASTLIKDRLRMFENPQLEQPKTPVAFKKPTPSKIAPHSNIHSHDTASRLPASSVRPLTTVTPSSAPEVDPAQLSLAARKALFEAPLLIVPEEEEESPENLTVSQRKALFERAMNTPTKKTTRNHMRGPSPAKREETVQPRPDAQPSPSVSAFSKPAPPINHEQEKIPPPSPGILRKTDNPQPNAGVAAKSVRFSPSPAKPRVLDIANDKPPQSLATLMSPIKAPSVVGVHTQEMHQRLLGQRSTSTGKLVDKTIAERKMEMERLLFGRRQAQQDTEDTDVTLDEGEGDNNEQYMQPQDDWGGSEPPSEPVSESDSSSYVEENLVAEVIPALPPNGPTLESNGMSSQPSFRTHGVAVCDQMNEMLDEALDMESDSDHEEQQVQVVPPRSVPSPQKSYVNPISGKTESEGTALVHSVSVYRRQKQALCTPPVRVIQRKPLAESPPSPQKPEEDPKRMQEIQAEIQHLQENLHCQEVQVHQACQALHLCAAKPEFFGSTEHIEGERLLLIASHKRNAYRSTLERLKTESALGAPLNNNREVMGTLTLSEIRLPLKHEFLSAHVARTNGDAVHFFFCLIRYREKVIATEMLCTRDGITAGTLSFSNHICIQELQNNFNVLFEVYALQTNGEIVPHDRKYSIRKDQGRLKGKKYESKAKLSPAVSSPVGVQARERTSNFGLVGLVQLTVENCSRKILGMEKVPHCSPLDGRAFIKIQLCTKQPVKEQGFLTMFEDVSGFGAWHRRFMVLAGNYLSFWKYPEQVQYEVPMGSIDLRTCVTPEIGLVSADVCARKNTFMLLCVRPQSRSDQDTLTSQLHTSHTSVKHLVSADTKEERLLWCAQLNKALEVIRKWDPKALSPREVQ